jgi:hypothetical protein
VRSSKRVRQNELLDPLIQSRVPQCEVLKASSSKRVSQSEFLGLNAGLNLMFKSGLGSDLHINH